MAWRILSRILVLILLSLTALGQNPELSKTVQEFISVQASKVVLTHVRIIDGT